MKNLSFFPSRFKSLDELGPNGPAYVIVPRNPNEQFTSDSRVYLECPPDVFHIPFFQRCLELLYQKNEKTDNIYQLLNCFIENNGCAVYYNYTRNNDGTIAHLLHCLYIPKRIVEMEDLFLATLAFVGKFPEVKMYYFQTMEELEKGEVEQPVDTLNLMVAHRTYQQEHYPFQKKLG